MLWHIFYQTTDTLVSAVSEGSLGNSEMREAGTTSQD